MERTGRPDPIQNAETLIWLANLGVISQNPWLARISHPDRPDFAVFDLDPQDSVPFPEVCSLALHVKEVLDGLGLVSWVKTSGSRGIHIYVPLKRNTISAAAWLAPRGSAPTWRS